VTSQATRGARRDAGTHALRAQQPPKANCGGNRSYA
jgi:hypothetical protein